MHHSLLFPYMLQLNPLPTASAPGLCSPNLPRQYQPLSQLTRLCSAILAPPEFTGVNRNADSLLYAVLKNAAFTAIYARFCSLTFF